MDIDKISFTGSGASGRKVVDATNKSNMKKVTLELWGEEPEPGICGCGFGECLERVLGFIEAGKSEAKLLVGGERKSNKGAFVQPTIFLNPSKDSTIYREEIFGPVLTVLTFDTEEEAIRLANDTSYGLSATIYTGSTSTALRVASRIKAGTIAVNGTFVPDNNTPFGGYKMSGNGRELGKEGLMSYLQLKTIKINMAQNEICERSFEISQLESRGAIGTEEEPTSVFRYSTVTAARRIDDELPALLAPLVQDLDIRDSSIGHVEVDGRGTVPCRKPLHHKLFHRTQTYSPIARKRKARSQRRKTLYDGGIAKQEELVKSMGLPVLSHPTYQDSWVL
ncbi:ALDH-like protein [Lojkania enalia]|uniref:ALDH-like protein n=1 Tax=Lojkania enalia TaxID=147567 RepID=A0A9P4KDW5_9PLEO|nr:ALDH-like protein [Didymosphaeria enalia]